MSGSGIFAIETASWWGDSREASSIRPMLDVLAHGSGTRTSIVHHRVATRDELRHHLRQWRRLRSCPVLVLTFHGSAGVVYLDHRQRKRDEVTFDDLAAMVGSDCRGRIIHLGGCSMLRLDVRRIRRFINQTGVSAVTGYRHDVDWLRSASFELLAFAKFVSYRSNLRGARRMQAALMKESPHLRRELGFRCIVR